MTDKEIYCALGAAYEAVTKRPPGVPDDGILFHNDEYYYKQESDWGIAVYRVSKPNYAIAHVYFNNGKLKLKAQGAKARRMWRVDVHTRGVKRSRKFKFNQLRAALEFAVSAWEKDPDLTWEEEILKEGKYGLFRVFVHEASTTIASIEIKRVSDEALVAVLRAQFIFDPKYQDIPTHTLVATVYVGGVRGTKTITSGDEAMLIRNAIAEWELSNA